MSAGNVTAVIDGRSILLDDGREIRIAAIEVPPAPNPGETGPRAAAGAVAKSALEALVAGRPVGLRHVDPAVDRYGRTVAHVAVALDGRQSSVAHALVQRGYARVAADTGDAACAASLFTRERAARAGKLGLWGEPYYAILAAGSGAELLAERGHFTVAEGKILSVRESGGTIYMNFGRRWSEALTVTISKRDERIFLAAGLAPRTLANRRVRVRGFVDERNGPRIEASRPEQIELAELN